MASSTVSSASTLSARLVPDLIDIKQHTASGGQSFV
jgi:hypothetical protein